MPKNVCVVGAGMSGLAAARELRREGLAVTVVEQRGDIGGQWLYDPRTDTDTADPLGATAPVKVHSSMYASVRLISPRECMGFSDFQFVPRPGAGRDARRFPGHREVYCYLKDFCAAFGLEDAVRLNTKVVRVAMAPPPSETTPPVGYYSSDVKWQVRSVRVEPDGDERVAVEEVFDAVVVANGHYSQPRLPSIKGTCLHDRSIYHSYRVPDPFHGESGLDIATELCGVASGVHLTAKSMEAATTPTPVVSKLLSNHAEIQLRPPVDHLCEDGTVAFADGSCVVANTVIYCTGYVYSIPFLDTGGLVTVDGGGERVGPLYGHTFPPAMAPSLSFVGVPTAVFAPWFFEAQARWIALVLSGRKTLPSPEEMSRPNPPAQPFFLLLLSLFRCQVGPSRQGLLPRVAEPDSPSSHGRARLDLRFPSRKLWSPGLFKPPRALRVAQSSLAAGTLGLEPPPRFVPSRPPSSLQARRRVAREGKEAAKPLSSLSLALSSPRRACRRSRAAVYRRKPPPSFNPRLDPLKPTSLSASLLPSQSRRETELPSVGFARLRRIVASAAAFCPFDPEPLDLNPTAVIRSISRAVLQKSP
ncbi:hypothetical protein HU200_035563 [Digitaria exilis]|uniref:Flavin-containing monooxygenase n=1 Tax=Digitaria exilis TaxID=1010633 RepID=A0A835EJ00_9POAL|nr:hypothetical protein HU200_035563 [Digitaria exilis]